ncbi:hypothetical protein GCM10020219_088390 [Nonomuraea dietziae]
MLQVKIERVDTFVVKLVPPEAYLGAHPGEAEGGYFLRPPWRSLYSSRFETVLTRITCSDGSYGWGEGLAPVAPEVLKEIIDRLLAPALLGQDPRRVRPLWTRLGGLMRERGHLVGHQADAMAAVDIALWDLAGKLHGAPVHALLGGAFRDEVPTYVSGTAAPHRRRARRAGRRMGGPRGQGRQAAPGQRRGGGSGDLRRGGGRAPRPQDRHRRALGLRPVAGAAPRQGARRTWRLVPRGAARP